MSSSLFLRFAGRRWWPYPLRNLWDQQRVELALRELERTRPVYALPPAEAAAEVHMLVCRRDLRLAVLSLKSLLRFPEVRVAVNLTNDGTLTRDHQAWIDRHIVGCNWLPRHVDVAAVREAIGARPYLRDLYHSSYHCSCKLLHPICVARCPLVIVLDADTVFLRPPSLLVDWIQGRDPNAYYLHHISEKEQKVGSDVKLLFEEAFAHINKTNGNWRIGHYHFNAGLLLFRPTQCDLDVAEGYLRWHRQYRARPMANKPYWFNSVTRRVMPGFIVEKYVPPIPFWFNDWTRENTSYQFMFAQMHRPARPLGDEYCLGKHRSGCFNHFMRHIVVHSHTLQGLQRLTQQLLSTDTVSNR